MFFLTLKISKKVSEERFFAVPSSKRLFYMVLEATIILTFRY